MVTICVVCLGQSMCHTQITVITVDLKHSSVVPLKEVFKILNAVQLVCSDVDNDSPKVVVNNCRRMSKTTPL